MRENWLKPNRRAIGFGCVAPVLVALFGAALALPSNASSISRWAGIAMLAVGAVITAFLLWQLGRPRIAFHNGNVLFYLRAVRPIGVPVAFVEAFFLGQGPTQLPGAAGRQETVNLVARLSQRQTEWAAMRVNPALGSWCQGYVTIRGTWCQPLGTDTIRQLNRRLKEVQTEHFAQQAAR